MNEAISQITPYEATLALLAERKIDLEDIAKLVLWLQQPYLPDLNLADCLDAVENVLRKREVQYAVLTGLSIDKACEQKLLPEVLETAISSDAPLFGLDETFGMSIANIYGTIGVTNFGYLDKIKKGIIGDLNDDPLHVHTFADDIVGAIAAAGAARLAHGPREDVL